QVLDPATYSTVPIDGKICREAMKSFASHYSFDDFRALDEESKDFIMKSAHAAMNSLDSAYRCTHHFPNDDDIRTPGYTTYVRTRELEQFFENCPDKIDSVIIREIRVGFEKTVKGVRRYFKRVKPTDFEFLALFGLSLWNDEIFNLNEKLLHIAMRNRSMILRELHSYYTHQGNYAERIGHIYSLLVYFQ
ncbi:hypothetical protein PENTCL1PPCAC_20305, partial [Pristionchus entomophagus]